MKIRPVGAELFHAYGRTDGHDEPISPFFFFFFFFCCNFAILRTRLKSNKEI